MPAQFTLPPDTQVPFTGNPVGDANNFVDAHRAMGAVYNLMNGVYGTVDNTGVNDCTTAFAACMAAAIAGNGEMVIPPGTYNLNTGGLHITGPFKMRGLGAGLSNGGATNQLVPAVVLTSNTSGNLFDFPFQGNLWGGLEISGIGINFTGTGNVFSGNNIADSVFRDMNIVLTQPGSMAITTSGSISYLNILHERCNFTTTNATRTNPMVSISTNTAAAVSNCTWFKCKFSNNGLDNTQPMVFYTCTAASTIAYHYMDNFIECWFEHPFGGAIKCLAGQNITIQGCTVWDISSGQTVGKSTFYFGAQPSGGANCQGIRISGCGRSQAGPDGASTWDIECESTTSNVFIEGWVNKPATASTNTPFFLNLHGCNDVVLIGNQSPQGANVNGNSGTTITNPSPTMFWVHNGGLLAPAGQNVVVASPMAISGRVDIGLVGSGFRAAEGANAKQGTATLSAGTVVVANTSVTANSRIMLTCQSLGTVSVPSALCVSARTAGTSFTILASQATDTSVIAYEIFEPG